MIWWKKIKGKLVQPFSYFLPKSQQFSLYIQQFPQFPTVQHYFPIVTSFTIPNNSLSFQLSNITSQQLLALQFPTIPLASNCPTLLPNSYQLYYSQQFPQLPTVQHYFPIVTSFTIPNNSQHINNSVSDIFKSPSFRYVNNSQSF